MYFKLTVPVTVHNNLFKMGTIGKVDLFSLIKGTDYPFVKFETENQTIKVNIEWITFHEIDSENIEETSYLINFTKEMENHETIVFYDIPRFRKYGFFFENERNLEHQLWGGKTLSIRKVFNQLVASIAEDLNMKICFVEDSRDYFYCNILKGKEVIESKKFDDLRELQTYIGLREEPTKV